MTRELAQRRMRWLPIVGYSALWAASVRGDELSAPTRPDLYAQYAAALVARYGPGGEFWRANADLPRVPVTTVEIWNEPNLPLFWGGRPDPAAYADLFLGARAAVKRAGPGVRLMVGGLGEGAPEFLRAMYTARPALRGQVDAVGLHPYAQTPEGAIRAVAGLRQALDGLGERHVPIELTEAGWPTRGGAEIVATEKERAQYLVRLAEDVAGSDCGVGSFLVYTWATPERRLHDSEDWFGLHDRAGRPRLSGRAYAALVRRQNRRQPQAKARTLCRR
jgi:hypothetical protein